jgi:hypothetical protein
MSLSSGLLRTLGNIEPGSSSSKAGTRFRRMMIPVGGIVIAKRRVGFADALTSARRHIAAIGAELLERVYWRGQGLI